MYLNCDESALKEHWKCTKSAWQGDRLCNYHAFL